MSRMIIASLVTLIFVSVGCGYDNSAGPATIVITVAPDSCVRDGLFEEKDGDPDTFVTGIDIGIQVLNVDRPDQPFEDRGIFEFDLSTMPGTFATATLELYVIRAFGPYPYTLVLADYVGDGIASLSDFTAGVDVSAINYNGESTIAVDVTSAIQAHVDAGDSHAGFVLRFDPATTIAYNGPYVYLGSLNSPPAAVLKVVEP